MKWKIIVLNLILALLATSSAISQKAPLTGTLTIATSLSNLDVLEPSKLDNSNKVYMSLIFDTLIGVTPEGLVSADLSLAHKWEKSPDCKVWTFYLRKGIKFHNGDELTAEDVKFSLERIMSPIGFSTFASFFRSTIDRIEVLDPYTVRIHCKEISPLLDIALSDVQGMEGFVLPKKYFEKVGEAHFAHHPIGTGPYKVVDIMPSLELKMEAAFTRHWALGPLKYKYVVFKMMQENLTRIDMLKTGEADIVLVTPESIAGVKKAGFTILYDPGASISFLGLAEQWDKNSPGSNSKVRQAFALAVNGKEIHEHIYYGIGRLSASTSMGEGALGYVKRPPFPYDPQKAKELLKEAGYPSGLEIKIHSFQASWFPGLPRVLEAVAGYLKEIGVTTKIVPYVDYASCRKLFVAHQLGGGVLPQAVGVRPDPLPAMRVYWHQDSLITYAKIPELSDWLDKAGKALDMKERISLYQKADQYLYDNYSFMWALVMDNPYAIGSKVKEWNLGRLSYDINLRGLVAMQ